MRRKPGALVPLESDICAAAAALRRRGIDEIHGYELAKQLAETKDSKLLTAYGTLYRALGRLEAMGLLESRREDPEIAARENRPGRRLYRLTALAEPVLRELPRARVRAGRRRRRVGTGMSWRVALVSACVRHWTRLYTRRLPAPLRDARRELIESDLWESAHDRSTTEQELVLQLAIRLVLGVPHDLAWRLEQVRVGKSALLRAAFAGCAAVALLISFTLARLNDTPLPAPPVGPRRVASVPPPPPPGPPPGASASQPRFRIRSNGLLGEGGGGSADEGQGSSTDLSSSRFRIGPRGRGGGQGDDYRARRSHQRRGRPGRHPGAVRDRCGSAVGVRSSPDPRTTARLTVRVSFARGNRKPS